MRSAMGRVVTYVRRIIRSGTQVRLGKYACGTYQLRIPDSKATAPLAPTGLSASIRNSARHSSFQRRPDSGHFLWINELDQINRNFRSRAGFINRFGLKAGTYGAGEHWA